MVDFALALATAAQALNLVKEMRGLEKSFDAAEFKLKIAELTEKLADLKLTLSDARQELSERQTEIAHLENLLSVLGDTVEEGGLKYLKNADGKPTGHPICPVCVQKDGFIFHTTSSNSAGRPEKCPHCKAEYHDVAVYL
ncbi:MAG: hypothetical protein AB7V13_07295 [Pseudorhodoplanes sp.]|uniref:hypothetical protein n=1 Tax=Pseudorhodoplanes sp. TaxID=1934341 RepID=UPI003D144090